MIASSRSGKGRLLFLLPRGPYESLPCQREVARRAGGIPTGLAGLPITPANGQESLRLATLGTSL